MPRFGPTPTSPFDLDIRKADPNISGGRRYNVSLGQRELDLILDHLNRSPSGTDGDRLRDAMLDAIEWAND